MSKFTAAMGGNTGAILAGGGMCAALALGAYISFGLPAGKEGQPGTAQPVVQSSIEVPEPTQTPPQDDPVVVAQSPTFDELRRETDGTTVIAGRAEPLSEIKILLDGAEVATATADSSGGFAAIADLPPKEEAQVVSLSAQSGEETTNSLDEIILAPSARVEEEADIAPEVQLAESEASDEAEAQEEQPAEKVAEQTPEEPPQVAVLQSNAEGVSLLQPAQPQALTSVALDTIGYSALGDVQLTGRAQEDTANVRIYLDNRSVITLPVGADGRWRGDLPSVDEGIYTLRVDEVSVQGDVSSRVETPFKREATEVLAAAVEGQDGSVKSITVQTGATLWAIARDRYGDGTLFVRVFEANADSIRDPDLIYPGQVFDLPN